ncbi:MAG: FAD-binding protein [Puniceicoccales bacterium]|jgi:glycolate oxidase|nr:FAD-binding protein [Puniceicoccales bacterium]
MPDFSEATRQLAAAIGAEQVRTDEPSRFAASFDNSRFSFMPAAVVLPRDEADIAALLRLANKHRVPVTVRGAGSGCAGAAAPLRGGWVLQLAHWTDIEIDAAASLAHVRPGALTGDIADAAAAHALFYPPDPSSVKYCTIGGNIATNAGGLRAAKYGVCRDYVLGLEGFLPTGEFVRWGAPLRKYVSGYNMKDLWIGSEGTLGVITKAVLKLIPRPLLRHTFLTAFATDEAALAAAVALLSAHVAPSVLEFLDTQTVACAEQRNGFPVFPKTELAADSVGDGNDDGAAGGVPAVLLVEVDGSHPDALAADAERVREWARRHARAFRETADVAEAEKLWNVRRTCSQAMFLLGNAKLNEDIVVPLSGYAPLIQFTREIKARTGLATPTFGHAADGNFHIHIMYDRDDAAQCRRAEEGILLMMQKVVELGGAITGEHGIGITKSPFLRLQHTPAEIAAMLAIKRALDPNNILAPDQIFEVTNVWEHRPVKVTLPWDKH